MAKKQAPKQPKRREPPPVIKTPWEEFVDAVLGRGVRPLSLWVALLLVPGWLSLGAFVPEKYAWWAHAVWVALCLWTVPLDQLARFLEGVGNVRECLADIIPLLPPLVPYMPALAKAVAPHIIEILPLTGTLALYLKDMLIYPDFVGRALPVLLSRIDLVLKYNMIDQLGPQFKHMDQRHIDNLEKVLPDLVRDLDTLAPYFHIIAPHIVEICLRADKLFPVVQYILPYAEELQHHIWWLIPFADVDGFDEFMPYLDRLAPHIDEFAPFALELLPYIGKMKKHIPILLDNVDTLLPQLGAAVEYMDPLVYWLSDLMPLASKTGILRSKLLLKAGMPLLRFLPSVPESEMAQQPASLQALLKEINEAEIAEKYRQLESRRMIHLSKSNIVDGVVFYVVNVDGKYAGEFRYSSLRYLHSLIKRLPSFNKELPPFPGKAMMGLTEAQLEERRAALENYLQFVLSEPQIVDTPQFVEFVKQHRRWERELPILASPLFA